MRVHTQGFKEQIKELGREIDSRITYDGNLITSEQLFSISPITNGTILKSTMKQLDFESSIQVPLNTVITYEFGLKVNEEYEYLNYGNYIVYSSEYNEDTKTYSYVCYDSMLNTMKDYISLQNSTFPMTVREYLTNLCLDCGLTFKNAADEFANYNQIIDSDLYANLDYTYRDIFDELSQVTASSICIDSNDMVEVRYIIETNDEIDEEYFKDINVKFGEKYGPVNSIVLSRSAESDNVYLQDEESVATNGLCEIKIIDNQIMNFNNRSDYLPDILEKLNGLEYYVNDFTSTGILYYEFCDRYTAKIGENTYSCVLFNDEPKITQGIVEDIYTEIPEESVTDYTKSDKTDRRINQVYIIADKQNQKIESVVNQTNEQNQKIAKVTQTVDELNSKISDIAEITISAEDTDAQVELEKINESEPIRLVIRPIGESISYDYPHKDYPHEDFSKIRTIRFTNTKTEEVVDYVLPTDLLYYDSEHYDEFILDYEGQTCMVNKRVGYNSDGITYILDSEQIIEYDEYPKILLTEGDYKVEVLSYDTAYIFVRLMAQNIYTTQFYTKAETDSIISQTSQSIDLSVNKKLSNYSTTAEMNSAIQLTTNEINQTVSQKVGKNEVVSSINNAINDGQGIIELKSNSVIIDSDNFKVNKNGKIEATAGSIAGFEINQADGFKYEIYAPYNYNDDDIQRINRIYLGTIIPTQEDYERLDVNKDGVIDFFDSTIISWYMRYGISTISSGEFSIQIPKNNKLPDTKIGYFDAYGNLLSGFNYNSVISEKGVFSQDVTCGNLIQTSLESKKKNFEKLDNALGVIKNTDIYKYNMNIETDNTKKHIGFVIGDRYNYSKEITSQNNDGVDIYSMVSVCFKAIQEQQEIIEELKQEIKSLKESEK